MTLPNSQQILNYLKILGIIIGVIIIGFLYHSLGASKNEAAQNYTNWSKARDSVNKLNTNQIKLIKIQDSLIVVHTKAASQLNIKAVTATNSATKLKQANDSLFQKLSTLAIPDTCSFILSSAKSVIAGLEVVNDSLNTANTDLFSETTQLTNAYTSLKSVNTGLAIDTTRLHVLLQHVPITKKEKFLGIIPLPSKKQSFILGGGTVIVLEILLHNTTGIKF